MNNTLNNPKYNVVELWFGVANLRSPTHGHQPLGTQVVFASLNVSWGALLNALAKVFLL